MHVLAYLVYGNAGKFHPELTYSVLSFQSWLQKEPADIRLVLVCDEANRRPDLPVEEVVVAPDVLTGWQLGGSYNHAAKQNALRHILQVYDCPCLIIDCDTWATAHPRKLFERLGPGRAMAHVAEGALSGLQGELPKYRELIRKTGGMVNGYPISEATVMYNSGVFGVHPNDMGVLDRTLSVTRAIWETVPVFTAEQLAFSIVAGAETKLQTCEDLVTHYWGGPRGYYRYQIDRLFPRQSSPRQPGSIPDVLPTLQDMPPYGRLMALRARFFRLRRGNDGTYAHAWLCSQNALNERDDLPLANVWAESALATLRYGALQPQPRFAADFAAFAPGRIDRLGWLHPDLRESWATLWKTRETATANR
ncbi:MAG TPA: hypothetical protein VK146_12900 [Tabrizicola sp.]|nr:hypothetical protein [Tabrizicola sp.]